MSQKEVDETDGWLVDVFLIALPEMKAGDKKEMDELEKQFMGYA